jgi:NOL1/NOP2/sun family putative RNA methylase
MEYPREFLSRMQTLLGAGYDHFLVSKEDPPTRALHVNLTKITPEHFADVSGYTLSPIPYAPDGFYLEGEEKAGKHPLHHAGGFYMQEPSAMAPICCADVKEGMWCIDLCAAPGGKSTQIANRLGDTGILVSNEYVSQRAAILAGNLERMGLTNAVVTNTDTHTLAEYLPEMFDLVVVDAPCSGEGMFRKDEEAVADWNLGNVALCVERQREILDAAYQLLKVGGELIYSTCTFSPDENEEMVKWFLTSYPDMHLAPVPQEVKAVTAPAIGIDEDCARRFYPHLARGEGQFMARLQKGEGGTSQKPKKPKDLPTILGKEEERVWQAFVKDNFDTPLPTPMQFKGGISLLDTSMPLPQSITYARGVNAGHIEKGRVVPSHWLFSAYGKGMKRQLHLTLDDPRLTDYLKGEVIPCDLPNGWGCVIVEGCALGGIKVTGGMAKNHYPKGLRLRT